MNLELRHFRYFIAEESSLGRCRSPALCLAARISQQISDHALGLEFKEKDRLHEFLVKSRELYSDSERTDHTLFSNGDCILVSGHSRPRRMNRFRMDFFES